jgi:hypothetical protein
MSPSAAVRRNFREFESKDLASNTAVLDEPLEDCSALFLDLAASETKVRAYRVKRPIATTSIVVFPSLLTLEEALTLSRADLENETRLLLERKQDVPFHSDTYIYSIRAIAPAPFRPTAALEQSLASLSESLANDVRSGYLTHEVLYGLMPDEGRLVAVLDGFLSSVTKVEVKVRRAPEGQRAVLVTLTD